MSLQLLAKPVLQKITQELQTCEKQGVSLGLLYLGNNPVIENFILRKKKFAEQVGIPLELVHVQGEELQKLTLETIRDYINDLSMRHSGVVIQLPLDTKFQEHEQEILNFISPEKDVDVLSDNALELFASGEFPFIPAVAGSISELASYYGISFQQKKVALVGKGKLVGLPISKMFDAHNINYTVFVKGDMLDSLSDFDIIISGAGVPSLITKKHVTSKTVVFDAGTSEKAGVIAGDLDPQCHDLVAGYSPVPGGIGPLTVAVLFKNLVAGKNTL